VPGLRHDAPSLLALVETRDSDPAWATAAIRLLETQAGPETIIEVVAVAPGTIPRTSSGKPRRRVLWNQLREGELDLPVRTAA
jgi:acyl-CoA synthetase (AMP-forming)/AMP-acid ligase II